MTSVPWKQTDRMSELLSTASCSVTTGEKESWEEASERSEG